MDVVLYKREGDVGVIQIANPPVNALSHAVRQGLVDAVGRGVADPAIRALVLIGSERCFSAGADITEFGAPPRDPSLRQVIEVLEQSPKLTVAAISGVALGGGLELALGCDYRLARQDAAMGLPEVTLGLLPGAGGTQRLPRLVGVRAALDVICMGRRLGAAKLLGLGVVDRVVDEDLERAGPAYARQLLAAGAEPRRASALPAPEDDPKAFEDMTAQVKRRQRGFPAPRACIDAVRAAVTHRFDEGMAIEAELFRTLRDSPEAAAQQYAFFAERSATKIPGLRLDAPAPQIQTVGVVGAGTMGRGIAINFLSAGMPVVLVDSNQPALDGAAKHIRAVYQSDVGKGRIDDGEAAARIGRLSCSQSLDDLAACDLVIEAVSENMAIKQSIFSQLDRIAKAGAVLATNTSTLDVNEIARSTARPESVIGMHFFSPANIMKLLEVVRADKSADHVLSAVLQLSRKIRKVPVISGVCYGFIGNRILRRRQDEALALVNEGASPEQVDKVLVDFGMPMGPFAMWDLAGLDVNYKVRQELRKSDPQNAPERAWTEDLVESGRLGQKTGKGVFDYAPGSRVGEPSAVTRSVIEAYRAARNLRTRAITDDEILARCLYAMVNEAARVLDEGIAQKASDIDVVWIYGYGFPKYRGGLLYWADHVGLDAICQRVREFHERTGLAHWKPAPLLEKLAAPHKSFRDFSRA